MKKIYNHIVFLTEEARNDLHAGLEVYGHGYTTIIDMTKKTVDLTEIEEFVSSFILNSNSKKTQIFLKSENVEDFEIKNYIAINFNPNKMKINIDDILNYDNSGKEKINFFIMDKDSISYIVICDMETMKNNYIFMDEINNFSELAKI